MVQKYLAGLNRTNTLYSLFWRNLKLNNYFNNHNNNHTCAKNVLKFYIF